MFKRLGPGTLSVFCTLALLLGNARPVQAVSEPHAFECDTRHLDIKPRTVALAGSFNGWSKDATPMKDDDGDGVYTATIALSEGVHYYKFVVNGDRWLNDPKSDKELEVDDTFGGRNSAVLIGPDIRKAPKPQPNHINSSLLRHDPAEDADASSAGLRLRLRAQAGDVEAVAAIIGSGSVELHRLGTNGGYDTFGGLFVGPPNAYRFVLRDGSARVDLTADDTDFVYPSVKAITPDWTKHAVWYQIFPERFRNGDPSNDPGDKEYEHLVRWQADWWTAQPGEKPGDENFYRGVGNVWKRRYGGDIQGVRQALPYLRSLGVNAIYFNPIFEADSMHKYDTTDYRHIDDNFGVKGDLPIAGETDDPATWKWSKSDLLFLDFVAEAHRQGFRVILDGVFNHVGRSHPFFQDVVKNGKASKYADWFEIEAWPASLPAKESDFGKDGGLKFKAWDGPSGHLPVFKKDPQLGLARGPREHVFAITKRWLAPDGDPSRGIDGWRLDVPGDIPHPFWIDWRKAVKSAKSDAYISGEIWDWAQAWLQGDQFDAVMNYRFAIAVQDFFVNQQKAIEPTALSNRLNQIVFAYPWQVVLSQQNLFDSHDTDRFASMFVNPDLPYDAANRIQDNGPEYRPDAPTAAQWARMKQAVQFQMCFAGAPMIYYGDEAGMWSPDDPSNRQPMVWKHLEPYDDPRVRFNADIYTTYQRAIAARNTFPVLQTGFYRTIQADDSTDVFVFTREGGDNRAFVALNRGDKPRTIQLPAATSGGFREWLSPSAATVKVPSDLTGRPTLVQTPDAPQLPARGGIVTIELPPYGTALLTEVK